MLDSWGAVGPALTLSSRLARNSVRGLRLAVDDFIRVNSAGGCPLRVNLTKGRAWAAAGSAAGRSASSVESLGEGGLIRG